MSLPMITGQVLMRQMGDKDGRTLFMVVGLIAVPKGKEWRDEHQYTVLSFDNTALTIDPASPIDRSGETKGMTPDQMLTSPIWRV